MNDVNVQPEGTINTKTGYKQELKRTLSFPQLVLFGICYMSPTTVVTFLGIVGVMTHGMLGLAFCVAAVAMMFTAFSYSKMVTVYPIAGSSYSYTQRTFNPHLGFLVGWAITLDYALLPIFCYVQFALFTNVLFPAIPYWALIIFVAGFTTVFNYLGIDLLAKVSNALNFVVIFGMLAFFAVMIFYLAGGNGAATFADPKAFINTFELEQIGGFKMIVAGASMLILCYLGMDAATTVAEEAVEPEKNVGRSIIAVTLIMSIYFVIYSYVMQLAWPDSWQHYNDPDTAFADLTTHVAGSFWGPVFTFLFVINPVCASLVIHATGVRILFSMGRDGIIPKKLFGYVHPKFKTPSRCIVLTGVCYAIAGILTDLSSIASVVNFGALIAFIMVNVCVVGHFWVKEKRRNSASDVIKYLVSPIIGACVCFAVWCSLDKLALIIGGCWLLAGIIYLCIMTKGFKQLPKEMNMDENAKIE